MLPGEIFIIVLVFSCWALAKLWNDDHNNRGGGYV